MCLTILLAIVCVYVAYKRIKPIEFIEPEIRRYSADVQWDPYPNSSTIDISNKYDCNINSLRKCDINDPTTLFGCKELTVRCQHFDRDTEYHENSNTVIIPHNKNANEGYALAITVLADGCNPYHGDYVLVAANDESTEYMMLCECKNPGYIGNDNLLGSCENVYVCDGEVDSIDKPLDQVNCRCAPNETNIRYTDGVPVCKSMLVHEANESYTDWSTMVPWKDDLLIDKQVFNPTVRDNVNSRILLDPCVHALDTNGSVIPGAEYNQMYKTCRYHDYGVPVRTGLLDKYTASGKGTKAPIETVDGALASSRHYNVRMFDRVGGVRMKLTVGTNMPQYSKERIFVALPDRIGFGSSAQFLITMNKNIRNGRCTGQWPTYTCEFTNYFMRFNNGIPMAGYRPCPSAFLWNREEWEEYEKSVSQGIRVSQQGAYLDNDQMITRWSAYGMRFYNSLENNEGRENGMAVFADAADFKIHRAILT